MDDSPVRRAGFVIVREFDGVYLPLALQLYGKYDLPKGEIELGETPLEAAHREALEEANISELQMLWGSAPIWESGDSTFFMAVTTQDPVIMRNQITGIYEHHRALWVTWEMMLERVYRHLRSPVLEAQKRAQERDMTESANDWLVSESFDQVRPAGFRIRVSVRNEGSPTVQDILTDIRGIESVITARQEGNLTDPAQEKQWMNVVVRFIEESERFVEQVATRMKSIKGVDLVRIAHYNNLPYQKADGTPFVI